MFAGNKKHVKSLVFCMAFDSIKDAFSASNVNWEHHSCDRALKEFNELALLVADTVLSNMEDVEDLPYISGCPTKQNIRAGIDVVMDYYNQKFPVGRYAAKKTDAFKKSFEHRVDKMCKEWKSKEKAFFKR
jgi:hypothetical protein